MQAPTACTHTVSDSISLAARRSFHLSLTVLFTIGHEFVFSLGGWSPQIQPGFLVSRPTRVLQRLSYSHFAYRTVTFSGPPFQARSAMLSDNTLLKPHNPGGSQVPPVWALPISLAATPGISFDFFSSGYLDVSVPRVGALKERRGFPRQVSSFGHPRIDACMQLPEAYRSLPRPSSPTRTKASPVLSLIHISEPTRPY